MTSEMAFECLLVSHDPAMYCTLGRVLRNFSINVDHCLSFSQACGQLDKQSHDLVVIDWDQEGSSELLHSIWNLRQKRKPTIIAVSCSSSSVPGAHVTIHKPVTVESGTESLKSAYSHMLLDYRRDARFPLRASLIASNTAGLTLSVTVLDISEGGVSLTTRENLAVGDVLSFSLRLPDATMPIYVQARILWVREYGAAGAKFVRLSPVDRDILHGWLKSKTRIKQPSISA